MRARRVLVRAFLLTGVAAALALASRDLVVRFVADRFEHAGGALAEVARHLPSASVENTSATAPSIETVIVPPLSSTSSSMPVSVATSDAAAPLPPRSLRPPTKKAVRVLPPPLRVTRAEVDAAIASKVFGTRTKLARDESGKPVGLALYATGALARFGVQDGDVLVSANGYSLRTPEDAFGAVGALKDATRVTVVLRRGTSSYAVTLEVGEARESAP